MSPFDRHTRERLGYPRRIAASLVLSLALAVTSFRYWPIPKPDEAAAVFDTRAQETISFEEILPTRQSQRAPGPPAPVTPAVVPDDVVLPDTDLDLSQELTVADTGDGTDGTGNADGTGDTGSTPTRPGSTTATRPDSGPRPVRFVEPEYTDEARRRRIRAEVVVEVLVDTRGRVNTARIAERFLIRDRETGERESVATLGYGLEESALTAARQWTYRPARQEGRAVESWTVITFTFGL